MKLQFVSAHSRVGDMCKSFGLVDGTSRNYPMAGKLTTHTVEFEPTIENYREAIVESAMAGRALYRGTFTKDLVNESRRGKTDKEAPTEFLVLDIDGLPTTTELKGVLTSEDVKNVAEEIVAFLPKCLQEVSYLAVGSSSFGLREGEQSVHLHFILDRPHSFRALKDWLTSLNYTRQDIYDKLGLTPSKLRVKSIIDPCLGEPTRLVYIAPPYFGPRMKNPFANNEDRFVIVRKGKDALDLTAELDSVERRMEVVNQQKAEKLKELQKKHGLPTRANKTTRMVIDGKSVSVVTDPPECRFEYAFEDDEFVRYNLGGKNNNAYWVHKARPEVMHSFIPDEPAMLFREADPEGYAAHIRRHGGGYDKVVDEAGVVRRVVRNMYIDQYSDRYITVEQDLDSGRLIELRERKDVVVAKEWMNYYGSPVPDPVPPVYVINDPSNLKSFYDDGDRQIINRFNVPPLLEKRDTHPDTGMLVYGTAWTLEWGCPLVAQVIFHMLGDDFDSFEHFINWLAFIAQYRDKAQTAWLLQGTEGTGKGILVNEILAHIFTPQYAVQNTLQGIADDQFNGWMEEPLIVFVDEFNMQNATSGTKRAAALLRNRITEPTMMVRKMQQQQRQIRQFLNFIFATNDTDSMPVSDKRRYNVAPRQDRMLLTRIPLIADNWSAFKALLAEETTRFASFLMSFKVSMSQVTSIMRNEAKAELERNSMNSADRFFESLRNGTFADFIGLLDKPISTDPNEQVIQRRVQHIIVSSLAYVNTGKNCYYLKDDLRTIYSYLASKKISENVFGRMCSGAGLHERRETRPVGSFKDYSTRPRCIEVNWHYDDPEILDELKKAFRPANQSNVSSIAESQLSRKDAIREEAERNLREASA